MRTLIHLNLRLLSLAGVAYAGIVLAVATGGGFGLANALLSITAVGAATGYCHFAARRL